MAMATTATMAMDDFRVEEIESHGNGNTAMDGILT